ncbi:amidohydrolase family protein [Rhodococcus sp. T2V]|uniref:amidohydrolase family protein n=1 Tax=Rhodococcus sp. T2V TaxID=3034164 RepID=UPI0023E144FC|nr:amidohydrolase family protein [Rhodococcus sp. T2V]MDF3311469.1 amidohydrolase family protein [Rhodococcus sp. T2V]
MSTYTGPITDVDVHHRVRADGEIIEYLPEFARRLVTSNPHGHYDLQPPNILASAAFRNGARRADAYGSEGGIPGWNYDQLRTQLLDRYPYYRAVLTHDLGEFGMNLNPDLAAAVCSAANDWTIDRWLSRDERLRGLVVCPLAVPERAAAEIRRVGTHAQMDGVLLVGSPLGRPLGDPVYHPVYEAAAELGLTLANHQATSGRPKVTARTTPSPLTTLAETITMHSQEAATITSSFIVNGVFEKFPDLKLVIIEYGVAWIPSLLWRLDQFNDLYRLESPWVKKWPSEYVRESIKFSTQPIETGKTPHEVADFLRSVDGIEDLLCFSTDYPHMSFDDPLYVARHLPQEWLRKVFCDNACASFGWAPPPADLQLAPKAPAPAGARS